MSNVDPAVVPSVPEGPFSQAGVSTPDPSPGSPAPGSPAPGATAAVRLPEGPGSPGPPSAPCPYLERRGSPGYAPWYYCRRRADQVTPGAGPCTATACRTFAALVRQATTTSDEEPPPMPASKKIAWDEPPYLTIPGAPQNGTLAEYCAAQLTKGETLSSLGTRLDLAGLSIKCALDKRNLYPQDRRRASAAARRPRRAPAAAPAVASPAVAAVAFPDPAPPAVPAVASPAVAAVALADPASPAVAAVASPDFALAALQHHLNFVTDLKFDALFVAYTVGVHRGATDHAA